LLAEYKRPSWVIGMKFNVILEKAPEGGYTVQCVELPAAISQGQTKKEALKYIKEAIQLVLSVRKAQGKVTGDLAMVEVDRA
jgi:predicted RNase H-like HicB family nuclease